MPADATPGRRFDGARVLVTGGTRGVGAAICDAFAAEGATVAVNGTGQASVEGFLDGRERAPFIAAPGAIHDRISAFSVVDRAVSALGGLDVLCANAGIFAEVPFEQVDQAHFDETMAVNLAGLFFACQAAMPALVESRGAIVATASDAGLISYAGAPTYSASKGAVVSLVKSLAIGYAQAGVRVNCVCPGNVDTDMMTRSAERAEDPVAYRAAAAARAPMRRMARPQEVAEAALFLASPGAGFTTGVALPIDGGGVAGFD
ncbi:MAG: SDR family NAD(P)-dependent oxidoreductase [Marivibrio sp.]|uniref:SDR family NAD(P)-dependent oxidoreductase n=1 Tax=Marivibrio sp. TaxID=2039719 RepID=UPI0032ED4337